MPCASSEGFFFSWMGDMFASVDALGKDSSFKLTVKSCYNG